MFFQGQNGQSMTTYICEKNLKLFVTDVDDIEATQFRDTLKLYLKEEKEFREYRDRLALKLEAKEKKLADAFGSHIHCLKNLHTKYGHEMISATYNEFDHKIHIDPDKKLYVVVKECVIDDLDKPLTITVDIEDDDDLS